VPLTLPSPVHACAVSGEGAPKVEFVVLACLALTVTMCHRCIAANGYDVEYLRVPVTDEKAPKTSDFAILAARAWDPPEGAALMYNCQMGRGRTTTGMIIASLIILRRRLSDSKGTASGSAAPGRDFCILMHTNL